MLKVGSTYEVSITGLDYKGSGIAQVEGSYLYIDGALTDEVVLVKLYKFKNNVGFARLLEVVTPSKDRVSSVSNLGSLNLSHLAFNEQLNWQSKVTKDTFDKVLKNDFKIEDIITDNNEFNYRNKVVFHTLETKKLKLGLYKNNSKDLVVVENFSLANKNVNELLKLINDSGIVVDYRKLKHVMFKNNSLNEVLVTLVATNRSFNGKEDLVELLSVIPFVKGITLNIKISEEVILGSKSYLLFGTNTLVENDLLITDQSFMQVNFGVMDKTFEIIKNNIKGNKVIDAYSGIGSIAYSVCDKKDHITLIESNLENIKLAEKIKENKGFTNVTIEHALAEDSLQKFKAETLIVDPPRAGLKPSFVDEVNNQKFERLIYLSCNLQSLVRDLRLLDENYEVDKIYPVKMFPQTNSFETLVILNIKK